MNEDNYVSRFFMHVTDIPGDQMKNCEDMVIRALKYRLEKRVYGMSKTYALHH
jgi:hypothetical protein